MGDTERAGAVQSGHSASPLSSYDVLGNGLVSPTRAVLITKWDSNTYIWRRAKVRDNAQ